MNRFVTLSLVLALAGALAAPAAAQTEVSVRQLIEVPQTTIDALNALGADASISEIQDLLDGANPFQGQLTQFEAVVLSEPRYSGLSGIDGGVPNRLHFFVRDRDAMADDEFAGQTIQIVDDRQISSVLDLRRGDVVQVTGRLNPFFGSGGASWQFTPEDTGSIVIIDQVPPDDPILDPVTVMTSEINEVVAMAGGEDLVQINWDNWNSLNNQYVRLESAIVTDSDQGDGPTETSRPDFAVRSPGEDARVDMFDISLRYRNGCNGTASPCYEIYPDPPYLPREEGNPFIAPPTSAIVDLQGFLVFQGEDAFNIGSPEEAIWNLSPITDDDLTILESPPVIALLTLDFVPTDDFTVQAEVSPGGSSPIAEATLNYRFTNGTEGSVEMTEAGIGTYEAEVPVGDDEGGEFVFLSVTAEDGEGLSSTTDEVYTRVLPDGINDISDIQATPNDVEGPSPFAQVTTAMDLEAVVMSEPDVSEIIVIQDGTEPFSGIFLDYDEAVAQLLARGDRVRITEAEIFEAQGEFTRIAVLPGNIEVIGTDDPYPYIDDFPTGLLDQDPDFAEQYEGMALRFEDVTIVEADAGFGEWSFTSDDEDDAIFGDDLSAAISGGADLFEDGQELGAIQGFWYWSFGSFKLVPEDESDINFDVSTAGGAQAEGTALAPAFPNPTTGAARLTYTLGRSGPVRLEVFDVTGRRVAVVVEAEQAAGPQSATLETAGLAGGLYLVRLTAGDEVRTTKLAVTR